MPATPNTTRSGASTAAPGHAIQALQKPSPAVRTANQARVHPPRWTSVSEIPDGWWAGSAIVSDAGDRRPVKGTRPTR